AEGFRIACVLVPRLVGRSPITTRPAFNIDTTRNAQCPSSAASSRATTTTLEIQKRLRPARPAPLHQQRRQQHLERRLLRLVAHRRIRLLRIQRGPVQPQRPRPRVCRRGAATGEGRRHRRTGVLRQKAEPQRHDRRAHPARRQPHTPGPGVPRAHEHLVRPALELELAEAAVGARRAEPEHAQPPAVAYAAAFPRRCIAHVVALLVARARLGVRGGAPAPPRGLAPRAVHQPHKVERERREERRRKVGRQTARLFGGGKHKGSARPVPRRPRAHAG
ncbi:hypothetical protein B0H12DRAFT_599520, partial [Mycena haematopus]